MSKNPEAILRHQPERAAHIRVLRDVHYDVLDILFVREWSSNFLIPIVDAIAPPEFRRRSR